MNGLTSIVVRALVVASVASASLAEEPKSHSYVPKGDFVPNEATAIAIAIAVWTPIYGAETIAKQKPYVAKLVSGIWIVEGSLPERALGGVARAEIAKEDGRVLRVTHGK
jgi:hypothetical protein